jgi:hypothetical protein
MRVRLQSERDAKKPSAKRRSWRAESTTIDNEKLLPGTLFPEYAPALGGRAMPMLCAALMNGEVVAAYT